METAVGCLGTRCVSMLELTVINTRHPLYEAALDLRYEVLRAPLGMARDTLPTPGERLGPHIVAVQDGAVVGSVSLRPLGAGVGKLYQMAVAPRLQRTGVGQALVERLEQHARFVGLQRIELHAREVARAFYERQGYVVEGAAFVEVGLPHFKMTKQM